MRHLGYAKLAANNKPEHPGKAKSVLEAMLADIGARSLTAPMDVALAPNGRFLRGRDGSTPSFLNASSSAAVPSASGSREWSSVTTQAISDLNSLSLR